MTKFCISSIVRKLFPIRFSFCYVFSNPFFSFTPPSLVAQTTKHLPTVWETWVQSLGWEDLLEKEMAPHSSTLAWKTPWTEEPSRLQSMGWQSRTRLSDFTFTCFSAFSRKKETCDYSPVVQSGCYVILTNDECGT